MVLKQKMLADLVVMDNPEHVFQEVRLIFLDMYSVKGFSLIERSFHDVQRLFQGNTRGITAAQPTTMISSTQRTVSWQ